MNRLLSSLLASTLIWPLATLAAGLEIPALGVHLAQLPPDSDPPELTCTSQGDVALLKFHTVTLIIARTEKPTAPGLTVHDSNFRTAQQPTDLSQAPGTRVRDGATQVGGHDAWTILRLHPADVGHAIDYSSITYTSIGTCTASSLPQPRPARCPHPISSRH